MTSSKKIADDARAHAQGIKGTNLALKAKATGQGVEEEVDDEDEEECVEKSPEDVKYAYHEHMALANQVFWKKP